MTPDGKGSDATTPCTSPATAMETGRLVATIAQPHSPVIRTKVWIPESVNLMP